MNQFLSNKIIAGIVALALLVGVGVLVSSGDTSSTTRNAALVLTCATGGTCKVGDTGPGGGIVFYVAPTTNNLPTSFTSTGSDCNTTCKYLEAAPSDQSQTNWCSNNINHLGVTATGIGSGMSNTTKARTTCTSGAIYVAAEYSNNNKTDWYLPSLEELAQLYAQKTTGVGGFAAGIYWSSSEDIAYVAWSQNFSDGGQYDSFKYYTYYVRPVRAF